MTAYRLQANVLVEQFHPPWTDTFPLVLLGIRDAVKFDV